MSELNYCVCCGGEGHGDICEKCESVCSPVGCRRPALTLKQVQAIAVVIVETVRESEMGVPSSHLYVEIQSQFSQWTVERHNRILDALVQGGMIEVTNHLVTAR